MDNLTHSLTGFALARTGLDRFCPHATLLLILSANAPDADIVAALRGSLVYLETHRGYSHSLVGLPAMAALTVLIVAAIFRERLPWLRAWILCMIGVASHLLLDWTNSYGIRLLLPSSRWFHLDLNTLYDVWILAVLVFAAVWPFFARLVSREIGDRSAPGRGIAVFALAFFLLFDCGRAVLHARAVAQFEAHLYDDMPPIQAAALPNPVNPFRWTGTIETARDYQEIRLDTRRQMDLESAQIFYKLPMTAPIQSAAATAPFRYFVYFARFPVWSVQPVITQGGQGHRVELTDLRFGVPGAGSFHCVALENESNQILGSWFTFGSGANLGWGTGSGH